MLAGCTSLGSPNPTAQTPSFGSSLRGSAATSTLERLDAPNNKVHAKCKGFSKNSFCTYTVRGAASGPFPGTFVAKGEYTISGKPPERQPNCDCSWNFEENFTINSQKSKISGSISVGGDGKFQIPGTFHYTTKNGYSGRVKVRSIGRDDSDFRETFYGM
jgi:hypothetical protein